MVKSPRVIARLVALAASAATVGLGAGACGSDDDGDAGGDAATEVTRPDAASEVARVEASAGDDASGDRAPPDATVADASDATPIDAGRDTGVPAHFFPTSVTCIGDSITAGLGASSASTDWVSDLGGLLGTTVAIGNFGVAGSTMLKVSDLSYWSAGELPLAEAYAATVDAGADASPAVIVMLGTNDSKSDNWNATAPDRYRADYNAMIDAVQATTPRPLVFLAYSPPAFSDAVQPAVISQVIVPIVVSIAFERGLPIVDVQSALAGLSQDFVDGVHPDDIGHAIVAQTMHDALLTPHVPTTPDGG